MAEFEKLQEGHKLSETQYYTVIKKGRREGKEAVQVKSDKDEGIVVLDKDYIEKYITTAEQFMEEKKVGKIEAAEIFTKSTGVVMTVNFNKQVKEEDARKQMYELYANKGGKVLSEADFKKKVDSVLKSVITGEERTMVGRHYGKITDLGRVEFIDMEVEKDTTKSYDSRTKQVDPRTINWMIIRGTKYTIVKK